MRALVAALILGLGTPALADKVIIAPFDGSVDSHPSLPGELNDLIVAAAQAAKVRYTRGAVGLIELGLMANCSVEKEKCRKRLMATLQTDVLIAGSVSDETGKVVVTVVRIERGGAVEVTDHALDGDSEQMRNSFVPVADRLFKTGTDSGGPRDTDPGTGPDNTDPGTGPDTDPGGADQGGTDLGGTDPGDPGGDGGEAPGGAGAPGPDGGPADDGSRFGGVEPWTVGLIGAGVALSLGGVVTLVLAGNVQNDINDAPTTTPAELDALEELESSGRFRYRLTYGLFAAGAVTLAAGVTLAVMQRREKKRSARSVAVVPTNGGAAAFVGGSF